MSEYPHYSASEILSRVKEFLEVDQIKSLRKIASEVHLLTKNKYTLLDESSKNLFLAAAKTIFISEDSDDFFNSRLKEVVSKLMYYVFYNEAFQAECSNARSLNLYFNPYTQSKLAKAKLSDVWWALDKLLQSKNSAERVLQCLEQLAEFRRVMHPLSTSGMDGAGVSLTIKGAGLLEKLFSWNVRYEGYDPDTVKREYVNSSLDDSNPFLLFEYTNAIELRPLQDTCDHEYFSARVSNDRAGESPCTSPISLSKT